jgi:hypothetical protein
MKLGNATYRAFPAAFPCGSRCGIVAFYPQRRNPWLAWIPGKRCVVAAKFREIPSRVSHTLLCLLEPLDSTLSLHYMVFWAITTPLN